MNGEKIKFCEFVMRSSRTMLPKTAFVNKEDRYVRVSTFDRKPFAKIYRDSSNSVIIELSDAEKNGFKKMDSFGAYHFNGEMPKAGTYKMERIGENTYKLGKLIKEHHPKK